MDLLDKARKLLGSDYAVAKSVNVTPQYLSRVRSGERPISADVAADIAEAIGEDPLIAAIKALAAQAKTKEGAQRWKRRLAAYAGDVSKDLDGSRWRS